MARKSKGLTPEQIRERQSEAGKRRRGPRLDPGSEPSLAGHRVPERYGGRNAERDHEIAQRYARGESPAEIREAMGLSLADSTISYLGRYGR